MIKEEIQFIDISQNEIGEWVRLASKLFKDTPREELETDIREMILAKKYRNILVKMDNKFLGFLDISLRSDYVEGARSSPTGYIEGIYLEPEIRNQGLARKLITMAENWFIEKGCEEMGTDTWEWNKDAQAFHERIGFIKEDVLVHYIKRLK